MTRATSAGPRPERRQEPVVVAGPAARAGSPRASKAIPGTRAQSTPSGAISGASARGSGMPKRPGTRSRSRSLTRWSPEPTATPGRPEGRGRSCPDPRAIRIMPGRLELLGEVGDVEQDGPGVRRGRGGRESALELALLVDARSAGSIARIRATTSRRSRRLASRIDPARSPPSCIAKQQDPPPGSRGGAGGGPDGDLHRNAVRGAFENPQFKWEPRTRWPGRGAVGPLRV